MWNRYYREMEKNAQRDLDRARAEARNARSPKERDAAANMILYASLKRNSAKRQLSAPSYRKAG